MVITRGKMRSEQLVSYEVGQLNKLKELIRKHQPGEGFILGTMVPDSPRLHQATADLGIFAVNSTDGRAWFEAVAREIERRMHP